MRRAVVLLPLLAIAGACSAPRSLDTKPMRLAPAERARVEAKVAEARQPAVGDWTGAWNQAVDAGLGRATLEGIALDALADGAGAATSMLEALRDEYGGLSEEGRARLEAMTREAIAKKDYARALEMQIEAADDAPAYEGAWRVYAQAPPDEGAALLGTLRKAREKARKR